MSSVFQFYRKWGIVNIKVVAYELKLEKFSGPLEKLLELIEERKLDIAEVSLARVTDDFLKYLKTLTGAGPAQTGVGKSTADAGASSRGVRVDLRLVADFIAVASRLILIKSKFLLPDLALTGEEEESIRDLERRLKIYQEFKPALKIIEKLWRGKSREFARPYFLSAGHLAGVAVFYPGENLEINILVEAIEKLFESFKGMELETQTIREKIITIEEKIGEIIGRLKIESESSFGNLSGEKSRSEIIVLFLAILYLAREQLIFLEQTGRFSDIIIRKSSTNSE